jgi:propanediol dehydratase small subunit
MSQTNRRYRYPLMDHHAGELQAASGRRISEIGLDTAAGLEAADLQISAETLRAQAEIARQAGYTQLAANLVRAAELTAVPNAELLRMYEMLRPGRATFDELASLANVLVETYNAPENARLVREAAAAYRQRGILRRD